MKIISVCKERANVIHEVTECDGTHSLEFYSWSEFTKDGESTECLFYKGIYNHKEDTLTLFWQKRGK